MNDSSKMVVGRIESLGGRQVVVPFPKKVEVFEHQQHIAEILRAARAYATIPSEENARALLTAALKLQS